MLSVYWLVCCLADSRPSDRVPLCGYVSVEGQQQQQLEHYNDDDNNQKTLNCSTGIVVADCSMQFNVVVLVTRMMKRWL